jgi:hypothetical protein
MHIYNEWGFTEPPFQSTALPANEIGERLLVGRQRELGLVRRRLSNPPKIVTVEGPNGIGKTSLVNVAAFQLLKERAAQKQGALFVPCRSTFQLRPDLGAANFIDEALMSIAQTIISQADVLRENNVNFPDTAQFDAWLNSPQLRSFSGGVSVVQFGMSTDNNTSAGFMQSGFRRLVKDWLGKIFPSSNDGGIICVIDNLELLETSAEARKLLEQLRDELFNITGTRWVLCGALGIISGVVSSPRFDGLLHSPVNVAGIPGNAAKDLLAARIDAYRGNSVDPYLPIDNVDFERLYDIYHRNLRSLLGAADNYCQWVADECDPLPTRLEQKHLMFEEWLKLESERTLDSVLTQVKERAWSVFEKAIELDGAFSPSDFLSFGFNSSQAIRPHVRDLETAGLVVSSKDDGDQRRKTIQITTKGWLVHYARSTQRAAG